ncbi:uncharacterized protein VP01_1182g2 [Puccinia sorghi]|uniref:DUF8040 domain-containing protein n=1 Tax=Puccinia sorghi TaxID=27349 RepID=A0A0L6VR22_9BASI|nr:uncharacterized protein VP01_1182g2 [Puccinia sorghi]
MILAKKLPICRLLPHHTHSILHGNPWRCVGVLRIPSSTCFFICDQLFEIENEPISKLISIEEQLAISLSITGHSNSNGQAQDRFQHFGQTISKNVHHFCMRSYTQLSIPPYQSLTAKPSFYLSIFY